MASTVTQGDFRVMFRADCVEVGVYYAADDGTDRIATERLSYEHWQHICKVYGKMSRSEDDD